MSRTLRPLAALAMVAMVAVLSAGCGGTRSSGGTNTAAAPAGTDSSGGNSTAATREKAVKFAECMRGSTPAYRSLSKGDSGPDVAELNANLVHLGYATRAQLDPSTHDFSSKTASALRKLQSRLSEGQTGSLDLGSGAPLGDRPSVAPLARRRARSGRSSSLSRSCSPSSAASSACWPGPQQRPCTPARRTGPS
jgi:hypothetical protein